MNRETIRSVVVVVVSLVAIVLATTLPGACSSARTANAPAGSAGQGFAASGGVPVITGPFDEVWVLARGGAPASSGRAADGEERPGTGSLVGLAPNADGAPQRIPMPLEHTDVDGVVTGPVTSVSVRQRFRNPFDERIEAVYVFPLPHDAAVSEFVMTIGERRIRGVVRERAEAEEAYAAARAQGYVAALLTEERPNVFSQRVANIEPGHAIDVEIVYYGTVGYEDGWHEWVFPMVVGPRFNPPDGGDDVRGGAGTGIGALPRGATGAAQATNVNYLAPGERSGHEIDLRVTIDAGTPIREIVCASHRVQLERPEPSRAIVSIGPDDRIPNRDFVLRWRVAGEAPVAALASSRAVGGLDSGGGHFVLAIYPPAGEARGAPAPLELVFVIDASGSMDGTPIAQAKAAVREALALLTPQDTFQIVEFSNSASTLGARPVAADEHNVAAARRWLDGLSGSGGTMMIEGIRTALDFPHDPQRLRYVVFLTDGFIGNEAEIFRETSQRLGASRVFSFGVGSSVNRHLLDGLARMGNGAVAVLLDRDDAPAAMQSFMERVRRPVMYDLAIDWRGAEVADVFPKRLPDLLAGRPVYVVGRSGAAGPRSIAIDGRIGGNPVRVPVDVDFARSDPAGGRAGAGLGKIWARTRIAELSFASLCAPRPAECADEILAIALRDGILSPYTAFIAVDSSHVTAGDHGTTVPQAVPVPRGTRYETTVGSER
ncbi:MAG: VIT domain-containing protein [Phycisphaerales bacterium]